MSKAVIQWIGGPVLKARVEDSFHVHEALAVGEQRLLGEVIQLSGDTLTAQVYEDTTGLRPGDPVEGTGLPLSVALGPGILGHIFDGLLRPLGDVTEHWFKPGLAAKRTGHFAFTPCVESGETLAGGCVFGEIAGEGPGRACLVPPDAAGTVVSIEPEGEYAEDAVLLVLEDEDGTAHRLSMQHDWPVRRPRPSAGRLPADAPMVTGQRILDTLFPVARGGRAALPGGFGTGKTVLQESLAKWCDADIIIYVGCGERGNEMAEVLDEFPALEDPRTGRPLMERTVIIANTSNMPVAAREASIYTAITVAEYFRDQGLNVALMADSTSRWAEALREVSGRLGELPGESGYPAYLASRLADFYERAARVKTLCGKEGSVTVIGAVSPPAGDFSEPVTSHTKRYVRSFWALDRSRAQARFYPAIHPLTSYAEDVDTLARWWQLQGNGDWKEHRRRLLTLLEQQAKLERMARIVGKDALPDEQQMTLLAADLMNEGFLRQSSFSETDRYCSPKRQTAMLRLMMQFIDLAEAAVERGIAPAKIAAMPILRKLQRLGEEFGEDQLEDKPKVATEIGEAFNELEKQEAAHAS
ncbi:V-type ATP synthase subunit A [Wenzhouxiangella sp. XN24]|uniref:V-type ATP synthase subunit A n=1 Tax=Wenzhouxiangella sp. XN24 TaxID=2713569 RepID=UPI0013EB8E33|nr:V-type ATP synthase subunit A [Wenzhouxiangella sp. XN24]NGX17052.1 V-type ATP synthase subunit A [Wenzhouxiangella sp. XN24]